MQEIEYLICTDGKRRQARRINCLQCGLEHLCRIRKTGKYEFCSKECCALYKKINCNVTVNCSWCKLTFTKKKSHLANSKSGLYFCSRKCKDEAQKLGGIEEIQPNHFGTAEIPDYRSLFTDDELICRRCGYQEFKVAVQIHHKDHDRKNNSKENLEPLCANCHIGHHNGLC